MKQPFYVNTRRFQLFLFCVLSLSCQAFSQKEERICLLVRADDIGSFHDANLACIQSVKTGIARSVEIMTPCAWFPEAVKMLQKEPTIDVGIHLVLTSEWNEIKWRPLTDVPSLTDDNGFFYPKIWGDREDENCLLNADWKLEDIEKELRAQIELVKKNLPQVSHISAHMGFNRMDPQVTELVERLAKEYRLASENDVKLTRFNGWNNAKTSEEAINQFITNFRTPDLT